MKTQNERGRLTETIQQKSKSFLGREITTKELRLYPYLDYCWKNGGKIDPKKTDLDETLIIANLDDAGLIRLEGYCEINPTREFYNFVQDILAESYVMFAEGSENEN